MALVNRLMHFYWRFSRGATLGARAMVIDGAGRIFLIKHSYIDGWHLPGGGVETGGIWAGDLHEPEERLSTGQADSGRHPYRIPMVCD